MAFNFKILILLVLSMTCSMKAFAQNPIDDLLSARCEKALLGSKKIKEEISKRVAPLVAGKNYILNPNGEVVDVAEQMNRELANPILEEGSRDYLFHIREISQEWTLLYRQKIAKKYEYISAYSKKLLSQKKQQPIEIKLDEKGLPQSQLVQYDPNVSLELLEKIKKENPAFTWDDFERYVYNYYLNSVSLDENGLPFGVELIKNNYDMALLIVEDLKKKNKGINVGTTDLEQSVAKALFDGYAFSKQEIEVPSDPKKLEELMTTTGITGLSLYGEIKLKQEIKKGFLKSKFVEEFQKKADAFIERSEQDLADSYGKKSPDWNQIHQIAKDSIEKMYAGYQEKFNLSEALDSKKVKELLELKNKVFKLPLAKLKDGKITIELKSIKTKVFYNTEIGTMQIMVLEEKDYSNPGPILLLDHGAGTVKSNAASWKFLIPMLKSHSFNAVAVNLPNSGNGMVLPGYEEQVDWIEYRNQKIVENSISEGRANGAGGVDPALRPNILLGRSMGSTKGFAHSFIQSIKARISGVKNAINLYVFMSHSNPRTLEEQTKRVYTQYENGLIKGVIPDSLKSADDFSIAHLKELEEIKKQHPTFFKSIGDDCLFMQGNADEDGGRFVMHDLAKFRKDFAPLSHYYAFADKTLNYEMPNRDKINPERFRGSHFLMSNIANMPLEVAKRIFPMVADQDLPRIADQTYEAELLIFGFIDYRADAMAKDTEATEVKYSFITYREQFLKVQNEVLAREHAEKRKKDPSLPDFIPAKSMMEWFRFKNEVTAEDFDAAKPGDSLANASKRVYKFWEIRKKNIEHFIRTGKLLREDNSYLN